jgi:phage-related protein
VVVSLIDGITERLPAVIDAAVQIVTAVVTGIASNLPALLGAAVRMIATLATGLAEHIPDLLSTALDLVLGLVKYLIENAPEILPAAIELIAKLVLGLINSLPKVAEGAKAVIQRIKDTFSDIDWAELGRNIINGIKNGILNAASAVVDAVKDVGGRMVSGAKKLLKIESPSKVFRDEVGAMIPAGMAEGIEDGEPEIESSMDRLLRGFTADVDYNLPNLSDYAQDLGAQISASTSAQITVPVVLDGREIARATAVYTNEQLAWEAR